MLCFVLNWSCKLFSEWSWYYLFWTDFPILSIHESPVILVVISKSIEHHHEFGYMRYMFVEMRFLWFVCCCTVFGDHITYNPCFSVDIINLFKPYELLNPETHYEVSLNQNLNLRCFFLLFISETIANYLFFRLYICVILWCLIPPFLLSIFFHIHLIL
jgi:hypothetical protein